MKATLTKSEIISELNLSIDEPTKRLVEIFYQISEIVLIREGWVANKFADDLKQEAVIQMLLNYKKVKIDGNPYSYLYQMGKNRIYRLTGKEKRYNEFLEKEKIIYRDIFIDRIRDTEIENCLVTLGRIEQSLRFEIGQEAPVDQMKAEYNGYMRTVKLLEKILMKRRQDEELARRKLIEEETKNLQKEYNFI